MKEFPKGGLVGKTVHTIQWLNALSIPLHAANTGYFIVLSLFPALLLVLSSLRYTGLRVEDLMAVLSQILPTPMLGTAEELVYSTFQNASGAVAGISAITALWSASRGVYGLLTGLNAIYGVSENRSYFYTRSISVVYTFAFQLVLLLTLVLHVFGNTLTDFLRSIDDPVIIFLVDMLDLRFFFLVIIQSLLFTGMFMVLPNKRNRFWESLPGGLLTSIGWLIFSNLYSIYVAHFPRYANIYGSVYAVAISMLWLYFCLSILFYGGALNRLLMEKE